MKIIKKHSKKIVLLAFMCLMFVVQVKAQFFEEPDSPPDMGDGPGGFDDPPPNDVPLDTFQWVMLLLALAYGAFVFWKYYQKNKTAKTAKSYKAILPELEAEHCI